MSIPWIPILVKQGDDFARTLYVTDTDEDGVASPVSLVGATLTLHVREPGASSDALTKALAITTPLAGEATLALTATETAALVPGVLLSYEIEMLDSAGKTSTPVEGTISVLGDRG